MPRISVEDFHLSCYYGHLDKVRQFLDQEAKGPSLLRNERSPQKVMLVHSLRMGYFANPGLAEDYEELIKEVGALPDRTATSPTFYSSNLPTSGRNTLNNVEVYRKLFPDDAADMDDDDIVILSSPILSLGKEEAIKRAQIEIYQLLNSPNQCKPYLKEISDRLAAYFSDTYGETFPAISEKMSFKLFEFGLKFPVPPEYYTGIKKHSALQIILISILRKHNLAKKVYKWSGYVPEDLANSQIAEGHFVIEDFYLNSLIHGKLSHMIQWAIIVLAIEKGKISLNYVNDTLNNTVLSVESIFSSIVDKNTWSNIFDVYVRKGVTFRDPFRINSFIMQHPEEFPELAASLTDTYSKNLIKAWNLHNLHFPTCKLDEFVERLAQLDYLEFFNVPCFINGLRRRSESKGWDIVNADKTYTVAERPQPYTPPLPTTIQVLQPA